MCHSTQVLFNINHKIFYSLYMYTRIHTMYKCTHGDASNLHCVYSYFELLEVEHYDMLFRSSLMWAKPRCIPFPMILCTVCSVVMVFFVLFFLASAVPLLGKGLPRFFHLPQSRRRLPSEGIHSIVALAQLDPGTLRVM